MTKKYLAILTFLLLLLALSYGISRRTKPSPSQPQPPTPSGQNQQSSPSGKTPEPQIPIPEGWKVYENEELGFSVGYPGDWYKYRFVDKGNIFVQPFATLKEEDFGPMLGGMEGNDATVDIYVNKNFPYKTLEELEEKHTGQIYWLDPHPNTEYIKDELLEGLPAVERMGKNISPSEPGYSLSLHFIRNESLYEIVLFSLTKEGLLSHEPTFRKMLETFTFF